MRRLVVGLAIISFAALALSWAQADDQEIAKEITERLKQEQQVGHLRDFDINLKVADGNVLLKGHVTSREQQKLALETARSAKGVKHVVSDLQITAVTPTPDAAKTAADTPAAEAPADGSSVSDSQIGEQLSAELKRRKDAGELKGFGLGISVNKGVVVLRGRVSSAEQLQLALDAAKQAPGVRDVVSHVVVVADVAPQDNPPSSEVAHPVAAGKEWRDEDLSQQIAMAMKAQKAAGKLKGFDIDLAVEKGVATYTGQVPTAEQMQRVVDLARQTPGVRDVVNKLVIVPPVPQAKEVARAEAVAAAPTQTTARPVALERELNPAPEKTAAQPIVTSASYRSERSDAPAMDYAAEDRRMGEELTAGLDEAKRSGHLRGFGISVRVERSKVWLQGRVSSAEQRQLAADIAHRVSGVSQITNDLSVTTPTPEPVATQPRGPNHGPVPVPAPRPLGAVQTAAYLGGALVAAPFVAISQAAEGSPIPTHMPSPGAAQVPARYDHPYLPGYAWPSYAAYPNYAAVTYPKQYSPTAWPYIGPFYPYPQVPLGWRKVTLKWDDGWWQLNFKSK